MPPSRAGEVLQDAEKFFRRRKISEPAQNAEWLLCYLLKKPRLYFRLNPDFSIYQKQFADYKKLLDKKAKGVPLAHVTGETSFLGYGIKVNKNVLIPRPETEGLVGLSAEILRNKKIARPKILDLCSGSGCIAVALGKVFPKAKITVADICPKTIKTAKLNAKINGVKNIKFIRSDLFGKIKEKFDLIVSNPPYISDRDMKKLSAEVLAEPKRALYGGKDGLRFIGKIIKAAPLYLDKGGLLTMEIGKGQSAKSLNFFDINKWQRRKAVKDFAGINRYIIGEIF